MHNKLYEIAINVKPNKNCDMPSDMVGAYVSCYSGAENVEAALTKIVKKLKNKNYIFVDILDDDIKELDAYKWNLFVESAWKEFTDYFPTQKELLDMVKSGEVFFSPFIGYSTESD
jgi:hypothetical protein